jgi:hypothetical protein
MRNERILIRLAATQSRVPVAWTVIPSPVES